MIYIDNYFLILMIMMFFSGLYVFCFNIKHMLLLLLSLEFMILSIFFLLYYYYLIFSMENYMMLYFLVMSVSESVLGLSLLVGLTRVNGNDFYQSFNLI